jgi:hypothetical protein
VTTVGRDEEAVALWCPTAVRLNLALREFVGTLPRSAAGPAMTTAEPGRALEPGERGFVRRDGVAVAWERHGSGPRDARRASGIIAELL